MVLVKGTEEKAIKVKAVEKTLRLLEILAEHDTPLPLTRLGQITHMSLSTVHRLLNTLCSSGFVEREPMTGHYRLGLKAFLIGNAALQNVSLRPTALEMMQVLAEEVKESVYLAVLSQHDVIYSDAVRPAGPIQFGIQTGIPLPAYETCSGRLLLAYLPASEQEMVLEKLKSSGNQVFGELREELKQIREKGYTFNKIGMGHGIREISAPVFNHQRLCLGAIGVFRPASDEGMAVKDADILEKVCYTAGQISRRLGYPGDVR